MTVGNRERENVADGVGLLISILIRYPEVSTINFDPEQQVLRFNFIASGIINAENMDLFSNTLLNSIEALNELDNKKTVLSMINYQVCGNFTMIEIQRDVETLMREEIALIVALFRQNLENDLVTDDNNSLYEEDLLIQEEIIDHMLETIKRSNSDKKLFAFREEGRVLVFNN